MQNFRKLKKKSSMQRTLSGIKLHPAGQTWDESKPKHEKSLREIFEWADENAKSILIHCEPQKCDIPTRFEKFFSEYKSAHVILAHSNPVKETAEMLNKYKNVFSDTACISKEDLKLLREKATDNSKILFGSDFPVSHYFETHLFGKTHSLEKEYMQNCLNGL